MSVMLLLTLPLADSSDGIPCLYEGHLHDSSTWYGYLLNLTMASTGRMSFEFSYPLDMCCQNVLFYHEDQMSIIKSRMNCWQKESLLLPEQDQMLRLTPRFAWSGCHITHPNGLDVMECQGGRSFASRVDGRSTSWYLAVSNCPSLKGLDLRYRIIVYGHIGDCKPGVQLIHSNPEDPSPTLSLAQAGTTSPVLTQVVVDNACIVDGKLNTSTNWYGFIANISLGDGGGFRFKFTYPAEMQVQNVVLYNDMDVLKLRRKQSCWQKEGIIRSRHVPDQIVDLSFRSSWNGCVSKNTSEGPTLVCQGERRFDKARNLYMAVSNCRSRLGLILTYRLEVTGFQGDLCSGAVSRHVVAAPYGGLLISLTVITLMQIWWNHPLNQEYHLR